MKKIAFTVLIITAIMAMGGGSAFGMERCGTDRCCCSPFGGYCRGSEWGWYGARRVVKTAADAEKLITNFFLPERVSVSNMRERPSFFEAEVKDRNSSVIDRVIVEKNNGRIRSVY